MKRISVLKYFIFVFIIVTIILSILIYLGKSFDIKNNYVIKFNNYKNIYIKTRIWGLNGQHYYMYISPDKKKLPMNNDLNIYQLSFDKENLENIFPFEETIEIPENIDIMLFEVEIYYKTIEPNNLFIYVETNNNNLRLYKKMNDINIYIIFTSKKNELSDILQDKDMKKVNIYNGIE